MDILHNLAVGFGVALSLQNLFFCFIGVLIGTLIGVLPGIGPVATISLLLPVSFGMEPVASIIMMCGVYYGAMYGGSTTSILVNIPGEAASIVTCLDGYKMARSGRAGPALGMSALGSFIGGTVSIAGLMLLAPVLARWALKFGPPEYFALMFFGLTMVTYLCMGSVLKGLIMAAAGIAVSTVGQDPISGATRFTTGSITLMDGFGIVPAAMGIFGVGEVLTNLDQTIKQEVFAARIKGLLPTAKDWIDSRWAIVRGSIIGFFLGILPGAGTVIPTFISYTVEKKLSRHPEKFGTGVIEGVAGPETANNAATGGSLVTLLSLGIPANIVMAVLLGAFVIHGIQPGPLLLTNHPALFWGTVCSMYVGNVMLVVLNLPLIGLWVRILKVPYNILFPLILIFCFLGVYSLNNNVYEILIMVVFGVFGYLIRKFDYEGAPFLLGMVLGPMFEIALRQSLIYGDPLIFFKRPITAVLLVSSAVLLITPLFGKVRRKRLELEDSLEE
ncbi:MAG: tripartite tricarboxylate transporter permease [Deltaproteobacteria bacterium]|nr:tripartite tricarboxylate transporter permease [Deltaproteobacteria bacterium]